MKLTLLRSLLVLASLGTLLALSAGQTKLIVLLDGASDGAIAVVEQAVDAFNPLRIFAEVDDRRAPTGSAGR